MDMMSLSGEVLHKSLVCSCQKNAQPTWPTSRIWGKTGAGWGGKCPKKKCGCKKKPDFWFLGCIQFSLIFSRPRKGAAGLSQQLDPAKSRYIHVTSMLHHVFIKCSDSQARFFSALMPCLRIQVVLSAGMTWTAMGVMDGLWPIWIHMAGSVLRITFSHATFQWAHEAMLGLHQFDGEGLPGFGASLERACGSNMIAVCHSYPFMLTMIYYAISW